MAPSVAAVASGVPLAVDMENDRVDSSSFEDFYRLHYPPMVRLAQALADTRECAEEIAQDAFAKVYERWDRLSEPVGYLRVSVVNGARSELRKRAVKRRVGLRLRPTASSDQPDYLMDALDRLSPRQRTALVLRFYAQMSERETAETMGVRPGTVKSLVSRGLANLRRVIKP